MPEQGPASSLEFKPNFAEAQRRWDAMWRHEIIDRPVICVTAPEDPDKKLPAVPYLSGARDEDDLDTVVAKVVERAAGIYYGGDAMPMFTPSFGPDMFAAWIGAELKFSPDSGATNWAVPFVQDWAQNLPLRLHEQGHCWQRMLEFCRKLADATEGKMLVAHLDLHSNLDALSAIRTPAGLCMDLLDQPEVIDEANRQVSALYAPVYDALYEAGQMHRYGTTGWVPAYHNGKTNTVQCDFACMVSPEMFRRYILPALEEETTHLAHSVYHYDGPDALVHFDDLMALESLDGIQWTPGSGNKPFIQWMDLLKAIQAAGKVLYVPCSLDELPAYHRELKPEGVFYVTSAPTRQKADETVQWLVDHT